MGIYRGFEQKVINLAGMCNIALFPFYTQFMPVLSRNTDQRRCVSRIKETQNGEKGVRHERLMSERCSSWAIPLGFWQFSTFRLKSVKHRCWDTFHTV